MQTTPLELAGALLLEPAAYADERGWFVECWRRDRYAALGAAADFMQDNLVFSRHGVLRGLHFQEPQAQAKLVYALTGEVFDVGVDVRRGSPTFGRWLSVVLSAENRRQVYWPEGFAHGYCVTSESALVAYKCGRAYDPTAERVIRWDDPALAIPWPVASPSLSPRDAAAPLLAEIDPALLPRWEPQ